MDEKLLKPITQEHLAWIYEFYQALIEACRLGADSDEPEGVRYIQISDTCATQITNRLDVILAACGFVPEPQGSMGEGVKMMGGSSPPEERAEFKRITVFIHPEQYELLMKMTWAAQATGTWVDRDPFHSLAGAAILSVEKGKAIFIDPSLKEGLP